MVLIKSTVTISLSLLLFGDYSSIKNAVGAVEDYFNYEQTDLAKRSFGPSEWGNVTCQNVETCPGWPTNWERFNDFLPYDGMENQCFDCNIPQNLSAVLSNAEKEYFRKCRSALQSPIDLLRNVTIDSTCKDRHQMIIKPGNCRFDDLDFQVLPHVLRAYQPQTCDSAPNIDFSMGFPVPWLLEFTDISVPSHHTQEGRRYDAEVVMSHTYTLDGHDRYLANVAVFLEEGENDDHNDFLELYIRAWGETILRMRRACDQGGPVGNDDWETLEAELDALFETTEVPSAAPSDLPTMSSQPSPQPSYSNAPSVSLSPSLSAQPTDSPSSAKDPSVSPSTPPSDQPSGPTILDNGVRELRRWKPTVAPSSHFPSLSPSRTATPTVTVVPSASPSLSSSPSLEPSFSQAPSSSAAPSASSAPSTSSMPSTMPSSSPTVAPEIIDKKWYNGTWSPYHWVNMTNTEYYFRYLGSLVEPPCFVGVHWRVLRLPVKISPRQLYWLGKLLKLRLNPTTCENDMVGRPVPTKARVEVNRPQQVTYGIHDVVYCECINWNSTRVTDHEYCNMTMEERGVGIRITFSPSSSPSSVPSMSSEPSVSAPPSDTPSSVPTAPSSAPSTAPSSVRIPSAIPRSLPSTNPNTPPTTETTTQAPLGVDGLQSPSSGPVFPLFKQGALWYLVPLAFVLI